MLIRHRLLAVGALILGANLVLPAHADSPCDRSSSYYTKCDLEEELPGSGDGDAGSGSAGSGSGSATACLDGDQEVPCSKNGGTWSSLYDCYMRLADPQPPYDAPVWGGHLGSGQEGDGAWVEPNGSIYVCSSSGDFDNGNGLLVWMAAAPELPPPDPEVLAQQLIARIDFQAIDMGIAPEPLESSGDSLGAVGLPVWLWADTTGPNVTGPVSDSISERGYTVTLTATMNEIVWDLGDGGEPIICGIGQRFDPNTMGVGTPVACGRQNGYSQQGEYTVTATSHWEVRWQGIGESGTIPIEVTATGTVRIGEIQVVVTDA